jgi:SSS family transporter
VGHFGWIDWTVLAAYLALTSWIADRLAGQRQTMRDFFLGGRKLPWWAVSGSIVAAEISGVTFVSIPAVAWAAGGNYTYLLFAIGSVLARVLIGIYFVPAFYRHEIYSPYEFMGRRLGPAVDRVATLLFVVGAFLAQGARLFLAALMLDVLTGMGLGWAIVAVGAVSVAWTWMGGINSVVWTDVVQFVVLFGGAVIALVAVIGAVPGGWAEILAQGRAAGKFAMWDFSASPSAQFTFWTGLFGSTFLTLGSHGTDQNMAQRLFCCRDAGEARKAVIWSSVSQLLPVLMLTVGVGIFAYFRRFPMSAAQAELVAGRNDYLLPVFVLTALPAGLKGLLFAAIFSAATATSTLAAIAQTADSGLYRPLRPRATDEKHLIFVSRVFVLLAAVGLCGVAALCAGLEKYKDLLRLALAMAGYTYGAMLGAFLLALLPLGRDARGLAWAVPLTLLLVLSFNWAHVAGVRVFVSLALAAAVGSAAWRLRAEPLGVLWVLAGSALVGAVAWAPAWRGSAFALAFPWHYPVGTLFTLGLGIAVGRKTLAAREAGPLSSGR